MRCPGPLSYDCQDGDCAACLSVRRAAFDRMGAAAMVYSVRTHKRRRMLELAVGWAR